MNEDARRYRDDRAIYARGVAQGRALRARGSARPELLAAAKGGGLCACGTVGGYFEFHPPEEFLAQVPWYRPHSFPRDARGTECSVHPLGALGTYKFVVTLSILGDEILLSRRRDRATWETQGGHIEPGETPEDAARRELYEESGATEYEIAPLCDYFAWDDVSSAGGMVFVARIRSLGPLPESEMAEVRLFPVLPENLTYPGITPALFGRASAADFPAVSPEGAPSIGE